MRPNLEAPNYFSLRKKVARGKNVIEASLISEGKKKAGSYKDVPFSPETQQNLWVSGGDGTGYWKGTGKGSHLSMPSVLDPRLLPLWICSLASQSLRFPTAPKLTQSPFVAILD